LTKVAIGDTNTSDQLFWSISQGLKNLIVKGEEKSNENNVKPMKNL